MTAPVFTGSGAALLTLFDVDGRLLIDSTAELAQNLYSEGITAFLVAGTGGEFFLLEDLERIELFAAVRSALPVGATVLGHVGGVPGGRAELLTKSAVQAGVDAVVALPLGIEDHRAYYAGIVGAAGSVPVLAYHLPQAGASIPVELLPELGLRGVKDSEGDPARLRQVMQTGLEVYTGAPNTLTLMHELAAPGTLLGLANSHPALCISAFAGDQSAQQQLDALETASLEDFPTGMKAMTTERFTIPTFSRGKAVR